MREVCVHFQRDRAPADAARVRQALRSAFPEAKIIVGEDAGRYENILFIVESSAIAISKVRPLLESSELGPATRASCIIVCVGEHSWDDYLLLHHYDPREKLDIPLGRPIE